MWFETEMEQSLIFWGSKDTIYKANLWDSILFQKNKHESELYYAKIVHGIY